MKKHKDIRSEAIAYDKENKTITLQLHDELDFEKIEQLVKNDRYFTYLDFHDTETITDKQRNHYWALIGDIHEHTGFPKEVLDSHIRFEFMSHYLLDEYPSVSRGSMEKTIAIELLEFTITYCIQNDIPFRKGQFYLTQESSKILFALTMKRLCIICGKPHAEIHHATNLVGMGNDRTKHNHLESTFMALCREHHNEIHSLGLTKFMEKYVVKPIRLSERQLRKLNIQGNFKEEDHENR